MKQLLLALAPNLASAETTPLVMEAGREIPPHASESCMRLLTVLSEDAPIHAVKEQQQ